MRRPAWLLLVAAACGCGPSFTALYEGDARFEHCYALEDQGSQSLQKRADCWRDWMDHYTFGQTRDRVQYASARYKALTSPALPTDEGMMSAAPGGEASSNPALAPTSAFASPPTTASAAPSSTSTTAPWMATAPEEINPQADGDAGIPRVAPAQGQPASTAPAPSASALDPTILPPKKPKKTKTK